MGFGDGFSPSRANIGSSTRAGSTLDQSHQFTGSVHITASSTENSITTYGAVSASTFLGDGSNLTGIAGGGGGGGNVTGVASSTDNAIVRFDGTGGKTIQNSGVTIDDSNNLAGAGISGSSTLQIVGATTLGSTLAVSGTATLAGTTNAQALNAQALTATTLSGSSTLEIVGATVLGNTLAVSGNVTLGNAGTDVTTVTSQLTASVGAYMSASAYPTLQVVQAGVNPALNISGAQAGSRINRATIGFDFDANAPRGWVMGKGHTTDTQDFYLYDMVAEAYRLVIDSNGDFGIGVENPVHKLSVGGTIYGNSSLDIDGTATFNGNVTLGDAAADVTAVTGQLTASHGAYFADNVGIGITSPVEILHVGSDVEVTDIDASQKIRISQLANHVSARVNLVAGVIGGDDPYFAIETRDGVNPWLITEKFRIDHAGNVGIGTTTPDKTLAVDGTFGCTGSATFKSNVTLGDAAADVTTVTGQLTASIGAHISGSVGENVTIVANRAKVGQTHQGALEVRNVQNYGSIRLSQFETDTTDQRTAIFTKHYTSGQENHLLIGSYQDASNTVVAIGGGFGSTGDFNSCTDVQIHAAADTTTPGSNAAIVSIKSTGQSTIGTISGSSTLAVGGVSTLAGNVLPDVDNSYDLGSASKRWANVYTGDLHLKNERGNWTILEEEDYLCVINNKTGKKFKMMLQEIED